MGVPPMEGELPSALTCENDPKYYSFPNRSRLTALHVQTGHPECQLATRR